jgi:TIR domain
MSKPKTTTSATADAANGASLVAQSSKPLVFISHDSRDAELAMAFENLLTDASGGNLKSFRSSDKTGKAGMEYGSEWYSAIMKALKQSSDVVALLTKHSLDRPWILFETGVAKGRNEAAVAFGITLGIPMTAATKGPFAQFQNCADDEDSLTGLVMQLIQRIPEAAPREATVRKQVQEFLKHVAGLLKQPAKAEGDQIDETTSAKLFEEVKVLFRDLPQQVERKLNDMRSGPRKRLRNFHPAMLEEIMHGSFAKESKTFGWLLLISLLRDDAPWLYEVGMDVYRVMRSGDPKKLNEARREFHGVARALRYGHPVMRELFGPDDEHAFMTMRHLPTMADEYLEHFRFTASQDDGDEPGGRIPTIGSQKK